MTRVAVIGGIGSGKTAATDYLASRGARIVDADVIAREVVAPGQPAWQQLRDAFGDAVLAPDRTLDRAFVAEVVFHDASALRRLNHITHAAIGLVMAEQVTERRPDELVVIAIPLFRPEHRVLLGLNAVWCVVVDPDVALARLVGPRGLDRQDALARIAAQPTNAERSVLADRTIDNSGRLEDLHRQLDSLLDELART